LAETTIRTRSFENGLTLVSEAIPDVRSVAFQIQVPAGAVNEPADLAGITAVLENSCYRGTPSKSARELSDALDDLGVQRGGGADLEGTYFGGALLSDDLYQALEIYAELIRNPTLAEDQVEGARLLAMQRLASIKDSPEQQLGLELNAAYFPGPYGRSSLGALDGLQSITADLLRSDHSSRYAAGGAIVAVAGRFEWDHLENVVQNLFSDWGGSLPEPDPPDISQRARYRHVFEDSAQEQIGVAWPGVTANDPGFYPSRLAAQVLSGGMGARLFTEVREKRGLVYSVGAVPRSVRGAGVMIAYAGTTPDRRQECLDVLLSELKRLPEGVSENELLRARTGLLSSLVMSGESCSARAAAIARDQFILGRVRSLAEVRSAIESVTLEALMEHLQAHPPQNFTVVTLGPEPVDVHD